MPTQDMLLGDAPQKNVAVGLVVSDCNKPSPGLLEPGSPGPLVAGFGTELGGFGTDPCPLAAAVGATIPPPGEGLELGLEATIPPPVEGLEMGPEAATSGAELGAADPPPPPTEGLPKSQHCPKRACFRSVHSWSLPSNPANESFAAAQVVVVVCRVDDVSVTSLSEYI